MTSKLCVLLVLLGVIALSFGFDSRPYENKPKGPFRPPFPSTPPFNPHARGRRDLEGVDTERYRRDLQEQPEYLEEPQYEIYYEPSPRLRRFSVPIVVVPMPAPPPPPPMA